jgi:nucleotide-binding universal stress UspA family protein
MLIRTVVGVVIFLGVCILVGRPLVYAIIRFVNDKFRSDFAVVTAILVIMGILALVTSALGVQSVLGAFMAGVLVGESPILTRHIEEQTRGLITALFMPVFFGLAGLNVNLTILRDPAILEFTAALVLVASVGKFAGAYCGGFLGGLKSRECFALGCGLNARGSTEVIVASIGLSSGVFTRNLFTMIVAMAMLTTMLMPVMLRRALARLPMDDAERERLEREDIDARGFVSTLERLVLAVDTSVPGRLASRLAGILAGARGMPMTLLALPAKKPTDQESQADEPRDEAEKGAEAAAESARELPPEQRPRKADIIMDVTADSLPEKLVRANRQGHDLLFVGMKAGRSRSGEFSGQLSGVANDFEGALAILVAADSPERALPTSGARILVPVNGTEAARRAAELACLLAPTLHASVTALYVSMSTTQASSERRRSLLHRNEEAVLREIVQLAARYRADIRTDIRTHRAPEQPILKEAPRHHLLIMGVSRRPGERLFFGNTASAVLRDWQGPILFLAT